MANSSNALIAKARAVYGGFLDSEDYNNLVHKQSVGAVAAYLKGTQRFGKVFSNVVENQVHRGQVEAILDKNVFEYYIKLCKFSAESKNGFSSFLIKRKEIEQIVNAIIFINIKSYDSFITSMPTYLTEYASFDLMAMASCRTWDDLLKVLAETPYAKVLKPFLNTVGQADVEDCSTALYLYYTKWAFKQIGNSFKGSEAAELKEIFLRQADLDNLLTCYRMKRYFGESNENIKRVLKPFHYRITMQQIDEILSSNNPDEKIFDILRKKYFKENIEYDRDNLEVAIRRYNFSRCKKQLRLSKNGTMVMYALVMLFEVEQTNIRKIIEGIRYSLAPQEIEKLLVI